MPVTQNLMKPGGFQVNLAANAPFEVISAIAEFDHIVVTPDRLQPIKGFADADILAAAIFTGVITTEPTSVGFTGYDLSWHLGTPDGAGYNVSGVTSRTAGLLSDWVADLCPPSLTVGTVTNGALGTHTASYQMVCYRERLDAVCRAKGAEWWVNPSGTIDAAAASTLFVSSPTVIITPKEEGRDGAYQGLQGSGIVVGRSVEQYITKATCIAQGSGSTVATGTYTGSTPYKDFRNNTLSIERLVNSPADSSTNATPIATATVNAFNQVARSLKLSTKATSPVALYAKPGDYVYVFDQVTELSDQANQVIYRGDAITPLLVRVYGYTWPITSKMGVYARRSGATPTYTDLSDYIAWEDSPVSWDVGTTPRALNDTNAATTGATAYLGANADIAARVTSAKTRQTYTPTFSNITLGNGAVFGEYSVDANGWCDCVAILTFGSTTTVAAGSQPHSASLPVTGESGDHGIARIGLEQHTGAYWVGGAVIAATECFFYTVAGGGGVAYLTPTSPFAWTTGDRMIVCVRYPIA